MLAAVALNAGQLVDLYRDYLPGYIIDQPNKVTNIEGQLTGAAIIHPDMIYYKIVELQARFAEDDSEDRAGLLDYARSRRLVYLDRRSEWAKAEVVIMKKSGVNNRSYRKSIATLSDLIQPLHNIRKTFPDLDESLFTADTNLMNFYSWMFYRGKPASYDPAIVYRDSVLKCELKILSLL